MIPKSFHLGRLKRPPLAESTKPRRPVPAKIASLPLRVLKLQPSLAPVMACYLSTNFYGSAWTRLAEGIVFTEAPANVTDAVVLPDPGPLDAECIEVFSFPAGPGEGLFEVACKRLAADGYRMSTETPLESGGDFEISICREASTDSLAYGTGSSIPAALAAALAELEEHNASRTATRERGKQT